MSTVHKVMQLWRPGQYIKPFDAGPRIAHLFGAGQQGGAYLFDKAHQGGLFQDAAFTTPVTAVEQYVGSFLDWSGNGNHCAQPTSTARAKWSARVNRIIASENLLDAAWAVSNGAVKTSANTVQTPGTNAQVYQYASVPMYVGATVRFEVTLSGAGTAALIVGFFGGTYEDGVKLITLTSTPTVFFIEKTVAYSGHTSCAIGVSRYTGTATQITVDKADARAKEQFYLPYQRVNTSTDYDTAGFPHYLDFDGTDDYYASIGNIDFSGTDKMTVVAGYTKGDAGTSMQPLVEFLGYSSAGSFGLYTNPSGQSNQIQLSSFGVNLYAAGYPPGLAYVITAQTDLAAPFMRIRRDGVLAHQSFTAPTGTPYGNAALHIGRRFIGSGFLKGPVHGLIVRGAASSDAELSFAERYLANLQGRTL